MPIRPAAVRRRAHDAALMVFRRLPAPVRRGLVRAGTPGFTVGAVCAVDHEGHLLFLRQQHRDGWSLPGGLLARGEAPHEAVIRELREETGLEIEVGLPVTTLVNPRLRRVDVIYRSTVSERPPVRPGVEARQGRWLRPDEVLQGADGSTREILQALRASRRPDAYVGRVVSVSSSASPASSPSPPS